MRTRVILHTLLLLTVVSPGYAQRKVPPPYKISAGGYVAEIRFELVGNPMARALKYRQTVFRTGPGDNLPVKLFEESSTGRTLVRMREDGLLLVQPVSDNPLLFFPETTVAQTLVLPRPAWLNKDRDAYPTIDHNGHAAFHGDILFYDRHPNVDCLLIGFVRIDSKRRRIVENNICLEVSGDQDNVWEAAAHYDYPSVRIGDYVLYRNHGSSTEHGLRNTAHPWRESRIYALDIKTGLITNLDALPNGFGNRHKTALAKLQKPE